MLMLGEPDVTATSRSKVTTTSILSPDLYAGLVLVGDVGLAARLSTGADGGDRLDRSVPHQGVGQRVGAVEFHVAVGVRTVHFQGAGDDGRVAAERVRVAQGQLAGPDLSKSQRAGAVVQETAKTHGGR